MGDFGNNAELPPKGRTVPMKVICAGLPRTGTKSLQAAMERLGFTKTHHMITSVVEGDPSHSRLWMRALSAKFDGESSFEKEDWDKLLGDCQAVTDFPSTLFVPELVKAYPDAKVVLNTRDIDKWHTSVMNTIQSFYRSMRSKKGQKKQAQILINDPDKGEIFEFQNKMWDCAWDGDFEKNWRRKFHEHYETVRRLVPAENLLEYTVQEGWGPLCEFLDVPVPDEPFPRMNDTAELMTKFGSIIDNEGFGTSGAS